MRRLQLLLGFGVAACSAASPPPPPPPPAPTPTDVAPTPIAGEPAALTLAALDGIEWQALGDNGWRRTYRFDGERYLASGHPAWEESGRVELIESDPQRMRVRFVDRIFDGNPDDPLEAELTLADDHRSFAMSGEQYEALPRAAVVASE
jgi:hypothetical protein